MEPLNILIYPYWPFCFFCGATVVEYYLASILRELGMNVKIHPAKGIYQNHIFT
jgi:hypothetical protein